MSLMRRSIHIHQRLQQVQGEGCTQHLMPSFGKCNVVEGHGEKLSQPTVPHDLGRTRERCELPECEPIFGLCAQTGWKREDRSVALSCSLSFLKRGAGLMQGGGGRVTRGATDGTLKALWGGSSAPIHHQQPQEELSLPPQAGRVTVFLPLTQFLSSEAGSTGRPHHQQHAKGVSRKVRLRSDTARPQRS